MNENEKQKYLEEYAEEKKKGVPFFPDIIFKDTVIAFIVFILLIVLAYFIGAPLEARANPADATYTPRPEWYFLFLFQLLKYFPGKLEVVGVILIPSLVFIFLFLLPFLDRNTRRHYLDRPHEEFAAMIAPAWQVGDVTADLLAAKFAAPFADDFVDQMLRAETTLLITDDPVKRVDNMTMAWGLEARVPFLDQHLVELAARMPQEMKLRSEGKHVLKRIARGLLPDAVIDRPKGYFPMPALKFVRGEFLEFMRAILDSQACRNRGIYQRAYVEKLLAEPEKHLTRIQGSKLWHLALLEFWLQRNVDKA